MKDLMDATYYYINLDSRKDRKVQFETQEALRLLPPVERVSGVHGASLNLKRDPRIGIQTRVQILTEYRRSHYEIHSPGAIGASLSHAKAWSTFLKKSTAPMAIIMEDDANLPATFAMMLDDSLKHAPDFDICIFGWNHGISDFSYNGDTITPFRQIVHFTGAHCYCITRKAAKLLLKYLLPIETHIEYYMSNIALLHGLKIIRDSRVHIQQMDRILNVSDVRKPEGCVTCNVDDKDVAVNARRRNMI